MVLINNIILILIALTAIISLIKEIEVGKETLHEIFCKLVFGSIATGALFAVFYEKEMYYIMMNAGFLTILINRLKNLKK